MENRKLYYKNILIETINKKRLIGRPRTRWKDVVEKNIKMLVRNVTVNLEFDRKR